MDKSKKMITSNNLSFSRSARMVSLAIAKKDTCAWGKYRAPEEDKPNNEPPSTEENEPLPNDPLSAEENEPHHHPHDNLSSSTHN